MHRDRPVTQFLNGAAPGKTPGLRACWMLLGGVMLMAAVASAQAPAAKLAAAPAKAAAASNFVGTETCATCHEEVSKKFESNPHQKAAELKGGVSVTCENCHGAGKEHVDGGGDKTKIFNPTNASAKEVDKTCEGCHAAAHPNFDRSPHAKANVSCIGCHSVHHSEGNEKLLKTEQPKLCFQCHTEIKPQFAMPFHHKVEEGLVKCSDCHDAHGTFGNNNVKSTADQNAVCTKCHTETRGPFVYEHAAVRAEGCLGCHTPHGSQNARLLNMPSVSTLCNQCHSAVAAGKVHGLDGGSTTVSPCIDCHTNIHGSNLSQAFIK